MDVGDRMKFEQYQVPVSTGLVRAEPEVDGGGDGIPAKTQDEGGISEPLRGTPTWPVVTRQSCD